MLNEDNGWSDEEVQTAVVMWTGKKSSTEIAKVINKTRNAVIGKMHRLGCVRGYGIVTPEQLAAAQAAEATVVEEEVVPEPVPPSPPAPPEPEGPTEHAVLLLKAPAFVCRYPLWVDHRTPIEQKFVCGEPVKKENCSWCEKHALICFDPKQPRRR